MTKRKIFKSLGLALALALTGLSALAQTPNKPVRIIVAFAAGTGVAPFRGMWRSKSRGPMVLVFGARSAREHPYKAEMQSTAGLEVKVAYSRPIPSDNLPSRHIQDVLMEEEEFGARLAESMVENRARLYICGAHALGSSVHTALELIISRHTQKSVDEVHTLLAGMKRRGDYAVETYS